MQQGHPPATCCVYLPPAVCLSSRYAPLCALAHTWVLWVGWCATHDGPCAPSHRPLLHPPRHTPLHPYHANTLFAIMSPHPPSPAGHSARDTRGHAVRRCVQGGLRPQRQCHGLTCHPLAPPPGRLPLVHYARPWHTVGAAGGASGRVGDSGVTPSGGAHPLEYQESTVPCMVGAGHVSV